MVAKLEFFQGVFAAATKAVPEASKNREYVILHTSIIECIRGGQFEQGYVRNSLGYNSEYPSTHPFEKKGGKTTYYTKSALFGKIWNAAMGEIRLLVANSTANEVWNFTFIGMRGANGLILPYATAIEKESDVVQFNPSKDDVAFLEGIGLTHEKISKTGQKTFILTMEEYLVVLDRNFPGQGIGEIEETEVLNTTTGEMEIVETYTKHEAFVEDFRTRLGKYTKFRTERVSVGLGNLVEQYANW